MCEIYKVNLELRRMSLGLQWFLKGLGLNSGGACHLYDS